MARVGKFQQYDSHAAVETPEDATTLIVYRFTGDGKFYARKSDGTYFPICGAGATYQSYVATLNQIGAIAPFALVLDNTFTGPAPTWSYVAPGHYRLDSVGSFIDPKRVYVNFDSKRTQVDIGAGNIETPSITSQIVSGNFIDVYTNFFGQPFADGLMNLGGNDVAIEVRIY